MSGPQGPDQTQPWPGQDQPSSDPSHQQPPAWQQPAPGEDPAWQQQPPAYSPQQYPTYQQPGQQPYQPPQAYPATEGQYGQPPTQDYSQQAYPQYGQQPGQYGQQPGQFGQPGQYGQQPGQYPQFGSTETPGGGKRSLALVGGLIGLLLAVVVVVGVLGFWKPGFFVTTKLDVDAAQSGVQQILTDES